MADGDKSQPSWQSVPGALIFFGACAINVRDAFRIGELGLGWTFLLLTLVLLISLVVSMTRKPPAAL